ncbi:MAG: tol-pal system protein YbgF [Rhodospirillaceae bacterium]|nr:tol-pal system protein YbgF [Rhodospirillaceae bacterium]
MCAATLAGGLLAFGAAPAGAQSARETEDRLRRLELSIQALQTRLGNVQAQGQASLAGEDPTDLGLRILKLEQLVEQLTGQVEEMSFRSQRMASGLDQLSNDVNYRLAVLEQALGVPGAVAAAPGPGAAPGVAPGVAPSAALPPRSPAVSAAPDVDAPLSQPMTRPPQPVAQPAATAAVPSTLPPAAPSFAAPAAPGGFGQLRVDAQGRPLPPDPSQQMSAPVVAETPAQPAPAPLAAPNPGAVAASQLALGAAGVADVILPEGTPKQQYDFAFDFLKRQDFARAEAGFREFMKRFPNDPLAGNAQYWLGETHYVRGDYQKSVIEFMNGYQKYPKSNKGPDNLLKLGMSLANLGQTKEACTALSRLTKEYPDANDQIRRGAQQERQKLKCA